MSELDYDSESVKEEMWDEQCNNSVNLCVICPKCGGSSTSTCLCAREMFLKKTRYNDVYQYLAEKKENEVKTIKEELELKKYYIKQLEKKLSNLTS